MTHLPLRARRLRRSCAVCPIQPCPDGLALRRALESTVREIERLITDHEYIRFTSFGNPPPALVQGRAVLARTRNLENPT